MSTAVTRTTQHPQMTPLGPLGALKVLVLRNYITYRHAWKLFLTGFLEPVFYLFSIGIGVGQLVEGFEFNGEPISYAAFVAPGMLAVSAFNGALMDSTFANDLRHAREITLPEFRERPFTARLVELSASVLQRLL